MAGNSNPDLRGRSADMRLVTYRTDITEAARLGALVDDLVVDVQRLGEGMPSDMLSLIDAGPEAVGRLAQRLAGGRETWPPGATTPFANVGLLAPIPRPRKNIFGIGLNYRRHVDESSRSLDTEVALPRQPVIFSKPPTTVVGPGAPIVHDADITRQLDWEVELAVIIGTRARRVSRDAALRHAALRHVFGYSVMIDISARDCRRGGQWIYSKGQDTYGPFGPCIVTADEVPDPQALHLWLKVNGEVKQDSNTRHMLFPVAELVADISAGITLDPGDIIATGTPEGVGAGRTPQEWLWPGDVVEAAVEGIGSLRHPVVSANAGGRHA
jgi:2-keto-4-pentenoate hydratase/2-oxohepta-3-ene-1,7-dioic acid hydratase in catechol pathway